MMKKRFLLQLALVALLTACGGGGGSSSDGPTPPPPRLVGEIFGTPEQVATSDLMTNAGYGGYGGALETSRAIQKAGKTNMLDFLFLFTISDKGAARLVGDAPAVLEAYIARNADLLQPGVYVYLLDEMYLKASLVADDPVEYLAQLDDLRRAVALVRQRLPQVKIGLSFSPHATFGHPQVMPFIARAIALVDWVGTTTYWLGDKATTGALHDWSRTLPALARAAQPKVETWYIAQAFREPAWDKQAFREFMQTELQISDSYDAIIFFGWQETSELSRQTAGRYFEAETRAVYRRFLKQ